MTAEERRIRVRDKYREILGRNHYSQARRNCCYTPYSDGKYYSDCSSSVSYAYKQAGESFGILNTAGMYNSSKLEDVPVVIRKGMIENPGMLRIGDMLLFAGNDTSRKASGYVGHVEMVGEISGSGKVTLYGHGSGKPSKKDMTAYCKTRYNTKSSTPLGRRLLIRVRRAIPDDAAPRVRVTGNTVNLRSAPDVTAPVLGIAHKGETYPDRGERATDRRGVVWYGIDCQGNTAWVSSNMSTCV